MVSKSNWKKYLIAVIKITVSAFVLYWLYTQSSKEQGFSDLVSSPKIWHWLIASFLLCLLAHLFSYFRWGILVRSLGIDFSNTDAIRIGLTGLFVGLFAFGLVGGDSLRIYYASRNAKNRLADVFCSVFLDRAIGMLVMFSFATVGYLWVGVDYGEASDPAKLRNVKFVCQVISVVTVIGWLVLFAFFMTPNLGNSRLLRVFRNIPQIGSMIGKLSDAALLYREKMGVVTAGMGLSMLVNLCFVGSVFLLAMGLDVEHPSLAQHFVLAPISMAANAIPLPGGIGGMEYMLSYFYAALSPNHAIGPGFVVAIGFRLLLLILAAFGAVAWFLNREQLKSGLREEHSSENVTSSS